MKERAQDRQKRTFRRTFRRVFSGWPHQSTAWPQYPGGVPQYPVGRTGVPRREDWSIPARGTGVLRRGVLEYSAEGYSHKPGFRIFPAGGHQKSPGPADNKSGNWGNDASEVRDEAPRKAKEKGHASTMRRSVVSAHSTLGTSATVMRRWPFGSSSLQRW